MMDSGAAIQACMGGWCTKRDHCAHYHAEHRGQPAERLCVPGADGMGFAIEVFPHLPLPSQMMPAPVLIEEARRAA
jgi:hypothetical protein